MAKTAAEKKAEKERARRAYVKAREELIPLALLAADREFNLVDPSQEFLPEKYNTAIHRVEKYRERKMPASMGQKWNRAYHLWMARLAADRMGVVSSWIMLEGMVGR